MKTLLCSVFALTAFSIIIFSVAYPILSWIYSRKFYSFLNEALKVFDQELNSDTYALTENEVLIIKNDLKKSVYAGPMRRVLLPMNPEVFWSPLTIRLMRDNNVKWNEWKGKVQWVR